MIIKIKTGNYFDDLSYGDLFRFTESDNFICMKMEDLYSPEERYYVDLQNGKFYHIEDNTIVFKVDGVLNVRL